MPGAPLTIVIVNLNPTAAPTLRQTSRLATFTARRRLAQRRSFGSSSQRTRFPILDWAPRAPKARRGSTAAAQTAPHAHGATHHHSSHTAAGRAHAPHCNTKRTNHPQLLAASSAMTATRRDVRQQIGVQGGITRRRHRVRVRARRTGLLVRRAWVGLTELANLAVQRPGRELSGRGGVIQRAERVTGTGRAVAAGLKRRRHGINRATQTRR